MLASCEIIVVPRSHVNSNIYSAPTRLAELFHIQRKIIYSNYGLEQEKYPDHFAPFNQRDITTLLEEIKKG